MTRVVTKITFGVMAKMTNKYDDRDDVKDDDEVSSVALVDEGSRCKMAVRVRDSQSRRRPGGIPHSPCGLIFQLLYTT